MRPEEEFNEDIVTAIGQKVTAYFCLICLAVVLIMSIIIIFIDEEVLKSKPIKRRIFMLYEFQKLDSISTKAYTLLFIIRRLNIVVVSFLWQDLSSL